MKKDYLNWGVLGCSNISDMAVIPAIKASSNGKLYAVAEEFAKQKIEVFKNKFNPVKTPYILTSQTDSIMNGC